MTVHEQVEKLAAGLRAVSLGSVYTTFGSTRTKGLRAVVVRRCREERGGRSKRYFRDHRAGESALKNALRVADNMWRVWREIGGLAVNRSRSHFTLNPKAALELSSWWGFRQALLGMGQAAKRRHHGLQSLRAGAVLGFWISFRARTFKHLDWISPSDLWSSDVNPHRFDYRAAPQSRIFCPHLH